jgi:DNA polymerase
MSLSKNKIDYLKAMDIQPWLLRNKINTDVMAASSNSNPCTEDHQNISSSIRTWEQLKTAVKNCQACELAKGRTQTVFGVGNQTADLMIIGEAPGFHEDQKGKPFVGRAGQLLNAMLAAINLNRESIYIANILKCRPPNNRDPLVEEVRQCTPFLQEQVALVKPKLLLAVGRIAAHYLLENKAPLTQLRGKTYQYQDIPLIVTFHPAYLLRNPSDKKKAYEDLQTVFRMLQTS